MNKITTETVTAGVVPTDPVLIAASELASLRSQLAAEADLRRQAQHERDAVLEQLSEAQARVAELEAQYGHTLNGMMVARDDRDRWKARAESTERDAAYYKWRLETIVPLFQEARDALPAISETAARLHDIDLTLADRMDRAGTATRADFDSARAKERPCTCHPDERPVPCQHKYALTDCIRAARAAP